MPHKIIKQIKERVKDLKEEDSELHFDIVKKTFSDPDLMKKIFLTDKNVLDEVLHLYYFGFLTKTHKEQIVNIISELIRDLKERSSFQEIEYEIEKLTHFIEHELEYMDYEPGARNKEYIRLMDLMRSKEKTLTVDKAFLVFRENHLYYGGKIIQGIEVHGGFFNETAKIVGEHYTTIKALREIYKNRRITSSKSTPFNIGGDPYCYLAEPGRLNNQDISAIRKLLGAKSAEGCIIVKIVIDINHVWIRVKRNYPTKFAIESRHVQVSAPKKQKGFVVRLGDEMTTWAA